MSFLSYTPGHPLSIFIDTFWFHQAYPSGHPKERIVPQGTAEIIVSLDADSFHCHPRDTQHLRAFETRALLTGPHSEFFVTDNSRQGSLLGIHFKPGGLFPFLEGAASELHNAKVPLTSLWGSRAIELCDQLSESRSAIEMFGTLETFLLSQLKSEKYSEHLAQTVMILNQSEPGQSLTDLEDHLGLSSRRFRQTFTDIVGVSPKRFEKLSRFNRALNVVAGTDKVDWTDLAFTHGFFDQAHFINDFKQYTGLTPTTYRTHSVRHPNHIPLG